MARKKHEEEPENVERWMLTYLDMITLLMAFFTILYAMASVDATKFKVLSQSMSLAFGSGGGGKVNIADSMSASGSGIAPSNAQIMAMMQNNEFKSLMKLIKEYAAKEGLEEKIKVSAPTERGLVVTLADTVLFASGSAELSATSKEILARLGEMLFNIGAKIRVEGHTDNVPIRTAKYQSNWQLSTDRATNVIMYWTSNYKDQEQNLEAAGCADTQPIASNDTPEGRAVNRRVEIIILRSSKIKQ